MRKGNSVVDIEYTRSPLLPISSSSAYTCKTDVPMSAFSEMLPLNVE